jgi:hypothetical protein
MRQCARFGIVGGYGATGRVVVAELWKSCPADIRIGGRSLAKGKALAAQFDQRVSAVELDVCAEPSLDLFCRDCTILVHCGGPVMRLQDRVARAALRHKCHYVDLAGLAVVKECLLPHARAIADLGLSMVVSAGWLPGLSELLPIYAHTQAKASMDTIESLTVYFGDSGDWSCSAFQDIAWYLRRVGLRRPGFFRNGERVPVKMREASPRVDLGGRLGRHRFSLQSLPEQDEIARRLDDGEVWFYTYLPSFRVALAAASTALLPLPHSWSVRLLQSAFQRNSLSVGGFVVARVVGRSPRGRLALTAEIIYNRQRAYWVNGLVMATVARLMNEGQGVQPGVHFLSNAVDPIAFMAELQKGGIELSERVEPFG